MSADTDQRRRKTIPLLVKLQVALRELGYRIEEVQWDHTPPLALREWDPVARDTVPPANCPEHIQILSISAHKLKTTGRRGESDLSISFDGDVSRIAKAKSIADSERAYRDRLLRKEPGQPREKSTRWGKRPMRSKRS